MAKNENNSHAFIRKMVENIKQTKDAQGPDDAKMNEVGDTFWLGNAFNFDMALQMSYLSLHTNLKMSFDTVV